MAKLPPWGIEGASNTKQKKILNNVIFIKYFISFAAPISSLIKNLSLK